MNSATIIDKLATFEFFNKMRGFRPYFTHYLMPVHLQLESTTKCNLNCKTCMRSGEVNSDMSFDLFKSIIDQLEYPGFLTRSIDFTGLGETLLNPHLVSMVKYAKEKGLEVSLTTNFTLMDQNMSSSLIKAGVDYIYGSVDAASKQEFEKIRIGANFEQVMDNLKLFVRTRRQLNSSRPTIILESTISGENIREIPRLIALAEALEVDCIDFNKYIGVDGVSFSKQAFYKKEGYIDNSSIWLDPESLPKSKIKILFSNSKKMPPPCLATKECYITYDGKVLPCGNFMMLVPRKEYSKYQFGDLKYDSLGQVWRSSRYRQFRCRIAFGKYPSICKECPWYGHKEKDLQ